MFEIKNALKAAIEDSIPELTVIRSSWRSTRQTFTLPALVIDFSDINPAIVLENGTIVTETHEFHCTAEVSIAGITDDEAENNLEALMEQIQTVLKANFPSYAIKDWYTTNIPFGNQQALAGAFAITIET
jgi:hypothetical protein